MSQIAVMSQADPLTHEIIGAAIEVHRHLGPGMLESAYEECFCFELVGRGLSVKRQVILPLVYKSVQLNLGYRPDLVVDDQVIVELKCVEKILPVHEAQVLTYLRLTGLHRGLLINFQSQPLINGIKRIVRNYVPSAVTAVSASTSSRGNEKN
jgi:GxxExxY protein